ncbi:MAG: M16 family metallopeptidase [Burkholderiales bacterium]
MKPMIRTLCAFALLSVAQLAHAILPIEHWRTSTGAKVYFVENRGLPILDVSVDVPAGSAFDTPAQSGLAAMTNGLMRLGAAGMNEDDIARALADVGAQMSNRFDSDRGGLILRTLSDPKRRNQALEVMAGVLSAPAFTESIVEREKSRYVSALKEADLTPDSRVNREFYRLAFGKHPYSLRSSGEADTVGKLQSDDLKAFYRKHYAPAQAVVAIMGDVTRKEAEAIAEQLTRALPKSDGQRLVIPEAPSLPAAVTRMVEHPASQSHIMIGAPGIRRDDPDYFTLFVGNYILGGGGFVSRITEEVRQKRGLAYSAYSYFSPLLARGPFVIGMQTRRDQAGQALAVVRSTLREFIDKGPTPEEVVAAKQNIVGGFPMRIDSNRKIHDYLAMIGFYGLPVDYLETFVANIERVTAGDIKAAFARRVDPDRLVTVVVGAGHDQTAAAPAAASR